MTSAALALFAHLSRCESKKVSADDGEGKCPPAVCFIRKVHDQTVTVGSHQLCERPCGRWGREACRGCAPCRHKEAEFHAGDADEHVDAEQEGHAQVLRKAERRPGRCRSVVLARREQPAQEQRIEQHRAQEEPARPDALQE
eukprot:scaffold137378_cov27-Tisochrysis_lutea.AAC.3